MKPDLFSILTPDAYSDMMSNMTRLYYGPEETVVKQDTRTKQMYLVEEGCMMVSRMANGVENTIRFVGPGDGQMAMCDFTGTGINPFEYRTLTKCIIYVLDFDNLRLLMERHQSVVLFFNKLLVDVMTKLENHFVDFDNSNALSLYTRLARSRPDLIKIVPPKYLAQYLKMRLETFYRIRREYISSGKN